MYTPKRAITYSTLLFREISCGVGLRSSFYIFHVIDMNILQKELTITLPCYPERSSVALSLGSLSLWTPCDIHVYTPKRALTYILRKRALTYVYTPKKSPYIRIHSEKSPYIRIHPEKSPCIRIYSEKSPYIRIHSEKNPYIRIHSEKSPYIRIHSEKSPYIIPLSKHKSRDIFCCVELGSPFYIFHKK